MKVVERKPAPIYEVTCPECHSKIAYKKSEVHFTGYIICPVCGLSVWAPTIKPKWYELDGEKEEENEMQFNM